MNFIEMLIPLFILLILIEVYINFKSKKDYYSIPDTISDLSLGIVSRLTDIFVLLFMFRVYDFFQSNSIIPRDLTYNFFQLPNEIEPKELILYSVTSIFLFFLLDFLFYWSHRLSHEINILWASHVTHHSSEEFNLTVALRQSFLRNAITLCFYMAFAVIGVPWTVMLFIDALNRLYQFWVHTRFLKNLPRWFEYIFVTPSHHRVHHARNPEYLDKNYAGVFIIWDRIFGTFAEETEEPIYGIVKPLHSFNAIRANLHVFKEIFQVVLNTNSFQSLWNILFAKPIFVSGSFPNHSNSLAKTMLLTKRNYKKLTFGQNVTSILTLMILISLSLLLIKTAQNLSLLLMFTFYLSLIGGYGLLGNYLDRRVNYEFS